MQRCGRPPSPMKILFVDDEETSHKLLRSTLAGEPDLDLVSAYDGALAWWYLTDPERHFDLCICDLRMPCVDGLSLIERIRGHASLHHLPIMLCTAIGDRETVARAARLAVNHFLIKPYRPEVIREKIHSLVPVA